LGSLIVASIRRLAPVADPTPPLEKCNSVEVHVETVRGEPRLLKVLLPAAAALLCAALALGAVRNLWGPHDSPSWVYVVFGGFWIALALAFAVFAAKTRRRRSRL